MKRLRAEVATLLEDLSRTEGCIEDLQLKCRYAEESKNNISGSWQFSASQLELAETEIEDCNRIIEELSAEIKDRDEELEQLDRLVMDLERSALLTEKTRREQLGECAKELRTADRDNIKREKRIRDRQQEYSDIRAAHGNAISQQLREEKLCRLVEKLLSDLSKSDAETDRKNAVLKTLSKQLAALTPAATS